MSNFNCAKCGAVWLDQSWLGYKTECKHTMEEAMTTATPRTDAEQDNSETIDEAFNFARTLERELAARTAERDDYGNRLDRLADSHALTLKCYEQAEAENAELLSALEEIKGRVQFGVSMHMSSDVVKLCNEAIAKGKK